MKRLFIIFGLLVMIGARADAATATGGTITTNGNYLIHTFLSSDDFVVSGGTLNCEILIVAGGGGGGSFVEDPGGGAGGGGGGIYYVASTNIATGSYDVTNSAAVGPGINGGDSCFGTLVAIGGGLGGLGGNPLFSDGGDGGCGGGGGQAGKGGTGSQGGDGGDGFWEGVRNTHGSGGGGGNAANGGDGASAAGGGGGIGTEYNISGSPIAYGGGGGGASYAGTQGSGAAGGGGDAGLNGGSPGVVNTGGGGGGAGLSGIGGIGGSGIVIVKYLILPQQATTPSPTNTAINQATNLTLSWVNGGYATSYNVNFGISNNMAAKGNQAGTTYTPTNATWNTNYQWRIDSVNAQGTTTGDVWSFGTITILKAKDPVPADNTLDVSLLGTNLQWQGGGGETNFTVYFGPSGAMSNVYTGTDTNYATGVLLKGKTYTWRVDSENAVSSVTGDTWMFHSEFFVIIHKVFGVKDNRRVFGKQGNRIWGQ